MSEDIRLTVYLSTYNQEEFVAEALESILMQKTNFRFIILAADDCSKDRTQEIILDYQKKYPDMIETYFTPVNKGGCQKLVDCIHFGLLKGEYLAFLEGDDYWLEENRLQTLVDFLDNNPQYSRVSHKRLIIDQNDQPCGYDTKPDVLEKPFYVEDLLAGKLYSDFGSVFRNYYKDCVGKYDSLLLSSRNVCDFQEMFITQDFGPVYVMDQCFGVYRSRSIAGATNYNSITTQNYRCKENIRLAKAVETFYKGKYDLTPMIRHNQKRLIEEAVKVKDSRQFSEVREYIGSDAVRELIPEQLYLAKRGKRKSEAEFIAANLNNNERSGMYWRLLGYTIHRVINKITGRKTDEKVRGSVNAKAND